MRIAGVLECNEDGVLSIRRITIGSLVPRGAFMAEVDVAPSLELADPEVRARLAAMWADDCRDHLWRLDDLPCFLTPERVPEFRDLLVAFFEHHLAHLPAGGRT